MALTFFFRRPGLQLMALGLVLGCGGKQSEPETPPQPYAQQQPGVYPQQQYPGAQQPYPQQQQPYPQQQQPYPQQPTPTGYPPATAPGTPPTTPPPRSTTS